MNFNDYYTDNIERYSEVEILEHLIDFLRFLKTIDPEYAISFATGTGYGGEIVRHKIHTHPHFKNLFYYIKSYYFKNKVFNAALDSSLFKIQDYKLYCSNLVYVNFFIDFNPNVLKHSSLIIFPYHFEFADEVMKWLKFHFEKHPKYTEIKDQVIQDINIAKEGNNYGYDAFSYILKNLLRSEYVQDYIILSIIYDFNDYLWMVLAAAEPNNYDKFVADIYRNIKLEALNI